MSTEENLSAEEALIQKLTARYEKQLRLALRKPPRTLEQIEDTAEEVGNQVKRDIEEQVIQEQGTGAEGAHAPCACGRPARYIADYPKRLVTRHGVLRLEQAYYYCRACGQGFCPLDARLDLPWGEYSPAVVALCARFAGYLPPRAAVRELAAVCGITLSANTLRQHAHQVGIALQEDWKQAEAAFFAHPDKPVSARPAQLHLTLDGVMVHVDGSWQEAKVGCAYTRGKWGGVEQVRYSATLERSAAFGKRFRVLGHLAGADNCAKVGIVADGADWIWQESGKYYPTRVQILDYYHASQHLWKVAHLRFGEGSAQAQTWMQCQKERLLSDQGAQVIREVARWEMPSQEVQAEQGRVLRYLRTHAKRMRYQTFQEQGYHIGSGVAEAACKAVVQARMKGAGMRWKHAGAEAMLHLRCAVCSTEQPDFRQLARQTVSA